MASDVQDLQGNQDVAPAAAIPDNLATENTDCIHDPDWPPKKAKKKSTRPGVKPSVQWIAAQCIIEENNKWKKHKDYTPVKILKMLPEATTPRIDTTPGNDTKTKPLQEAIGVTHSIVPPLQEARSEIMHEDS